MISNARNITKNHTFVAHLHRTLSVRIYDNQCKSSTVHHAELGIGVQHATLRTEIGGTGGDENWLG